MQGEAVNHHERLRPVTMHFVVDADIADTLCWHGRNLASAGRALPANSKQNILGKKESAGRICAG